MRAGPSVDTLGSKIMGNLAAHRVPASPTGGLGDRLLGAYNVALGVILRWLAMKNTQ